MEQYKYKRELQNITDLWHKIELPNEIYGNVTNDLSDIRIFGITGSSDTIEAPYLLNVAMDKMTNYEVNFRLLNRSQNKNGYYFTFELPSDNSMNQIHLDFKENNFDWLVKLEGSQDQRQWFTIADNYRIVSIKNELTNYRFTSLVFPDSKYSFFRLLVQSKVQPNLTKAKLSLNELTEGNYREYPINAIKTVQEKQTTRTIIDINLGLPVPVSYLKIGILDTLDYYRPVTIEYLADSFRTEQGWKYNYRTLSTGTLSSLERNEFKFSSTSLQKLRITIHNHNNKPLSLQTFIVKGYVHELIARFTEPARYYLVYGNNTAGRPIYDIAHFEDKIPDSVPTLKLGAIQQIDKEKVPKARPLFINKTWLWLIMLTIILLLGWFTIRMIGKK